MRSHARRSSCDRVSCYLSGTGHEPVHVLVRLSHAVALSSVRLLLLSEAACSKCAVHLLSLLPIPLRSTLCSGSHFVTRWTSWWDTTYSSYSGTSVVLSACVGGRGIGRLQVGITSDFIAPSLLVINCLITYSCGVCAWSCQSSLNTLMLSQHGRWVLNLTTFCSIGVVIPSAVVVARFSRGVAQLILRWSRSFLVNGWSCVVTRGI